MVQSIFIKDNLHIVKKIVITKVNQTTIENNIFKSM